MYLRVLVNMLMFPRRGVCSHLCYLGRASTVKHRPALSWCTQGPCLSLVFLVISLVRCQLSPVSANQLFLTALANLSDNRG